MNIPAVLKVRETVVLAMSPMLDGTPAPPLKVTLCTTDWKMKFTVPVRAMSTVEGMKVLLVVAVTSADIGKPPVTVITAVPVRVTLPAVAVAVIVAVPAKTPVTSPVFTLTVAMLVALELHVTVAAMVLPN